MALSPKEREALNQKNLEWFKRRQERRANGGQSWRESIKRLHDQYYGNSKKTLVVAARAAGMDERKLESMPMGKAKKALAKQLGIRCFNAMTREELDEAIRIAQAVVGGNTGEKSKLEEIQAAARERTKARFEAIKAKKVADEE